MWVGINLSTLRGVEREGGVGKGDAGDGKLVGGKSVSGREEEDDGSNLGSATHLKSTIPR